MTLSIAEAIHQAQDAVNGGDYASAAATCGQLVGQFPAWAAAWRVLGEAWREQGQHADAERAYTAATTRALRSPSAWLGLGLIAEDKGASESALAFCQVAWELAPQGQHLRETLTRVAMRRYGSDGELQYSRAALAQLHLNAGRLRRAAAEYRRALAALPDRVDLQAGLAECLWRMGQDGEAAARSRAILERFPEAVHALVILADIEHREGNARRAEELLKRLRAVDPDGAVAGAMAALNPHADRGWLELAPAGIPLVADFLPSTPIERPRIAPAPDFDYRPARQTGELPQPAIDDLEPISLEEFGAPAALPVAPQPAAELAFSAEPELTLPAEFLGVQPIDPAEFAAPAAPSPVVSDSFSLGEFDLPAGVEPLGELTPSEAAGLGFEDFSSIGTSMPTVPLAAAASFGDPFALDEPPATDEGFADVGNAGLFDELVTERGDATVPLEARIHADDLQQLSALASTFDTPVEPAATLAPVADEAASGDPLDDIASLAASLELEVAGALARAGENVATPVDAAGATPGTTELAAGGGTGTGYTSMLESIGAEGLSPFDPLQHGSEPQPGGFAGLDLGDLDADLQPFDAATPAPPAAAAADLGQITSDWDSIDDEILRAMPEDAVGGYTDMLRSLDEAGVAPFQVDDDDRPIETLAPFDPFEIDQLAAERPSELAAPLPDLGDLAPIGEDELVGGLQPFSVEEFDPFAGQAPAAPAAPSAIAGWESAGTSSLSAVPSDDDLTALLTPDDERLPEPPRLFDPEMATSLLAPGNQEPQIVVPPADEPPFVPPVTEEQDDTGFLRMMPGLTDAELDAALDATIAATRALPDRPVAPEPVAEPEPPALDVVPEPMAPGTELFNRARVVKQELVSEGVIRGNRELNGQGALTGMSTDDLTAAGAGLDPQLLDDDDDLLDDDIMLATGSTRDTTTLRAALAAAPDDDELHWWLAEALRERGEMDEAYTEYRWLIRNAPERHEMVLHALLDCVERDQTPEMAHRLLGDIYRRRGDVARASNHAALALQVRRRSVVRAR